MTAREVLLEGGSPWGFRMNGGADAGHALRISRVNPGSKAAQKGVREGDLITAINGQSTRCLSNGESHALLRSVGDTLRLGLNQDAKGSPKRRTKEPLKRETSSSSSQSTPSTPAPDTAPASPATPSDSSASPGAKVFVCGIWNSVSKSKQRAKKEEDNTVQNRQMESSQNSLPETSQDTGIKASSSKARRTRKLKLKSAKKEEEQNKTAVKKETCEGSVKEEKGNHHSKLNENDKVEVIVIMDEEDVRKAGGVVSENANYYSVSDSKDKASPDTVKEAVTEEDSLNTTKTQSKSKNNKGKGFSLSNMFSSKSDKGHSKKAPKVNSNGSTKNNEELSENTFKENVEINNGDLEKLEKGTSTAIPGTGETSNELQSESNFTGRQLKEMIESETTDSFLNDFSERSQSSVTVVEIETTSKTLEPATAKLPSSVFNIAKSVAMQSADKMNTSRTVHDSDSISSSVHSANRGAVIQCESVTNGKVLLEEDSKSDDSRPISIFVVPPDNVAEEAESSGVDWESVSDLDTKSSDMVDDDDVRPETLIHLPSNDLQSSAALKDGRNGIVQIDDYDLSVNDLYTPCIEPEEEAKLRTFLQTLNLTKPEDDYDETSSSNTYVDSSSTSMSGTSPIPPTPSDEIVVYRHIKSHSIAESCYIPPKHPRHLEVITEENSDPSDSERRNKAKKPWENSELIRKNNEIKEIPNDWYGSDEEPMTTSDEGGIDTSWRNGRKLEDVEGVEIVYLSEDSDDFDEVKFGEKTYEGSISILENKENVPELVVVHAIDSKDIKKTVKMDPLTVQNEECMKIESRNSHSAVDEVVAILDSTFAINKELFLNQPYGTICGSNSSKTKDSNGPEVVRVKEACLPKPEELLRNKEDSSKIKYKCSETTNEKNHPHSTRSYNSAKLIESKPNIDTSQGVPVGQERILTVTPPTLSRQGSSSSTASQTTALYISGQSPIHSETEDNIAKYNYKLTGTSYNPKSLTSLSKEVINCLPHGEFYLKKIGIDDTDLKNNETIDEKIEVIRNGKVTSLPPSGVSTRRSSFHELENIYSSSNCYTPIETPTYSPGPLKIKSPPNSSLASPPPNDDSWVGLPTSSDRRLLICLSPSQSKDTTISTSKEATGLLDLHKKFVERRGYHESNSQRNSICSPKSERSGTPDLSSPDLIRLEPYESKKAQVCTPELLIEAANLLALKEYRRSRFKNASQSYRFKTETMESNGSVLRKNGGISGVTSPRTEINGLSEGDSNRSAGTSRLLALLQESGASGSASYNTVPFEMNCVDKTECNKGDPGHRYSGSYLSEWLTMSENVISNSESATKIDLNKNIIGVDSAEKDIVTRFNLNNLNNHDSSDMRPVFEAEKYKISKQGDIAIMQTKEDCALQPKVKSERPISLPTVGVPALSPSGGELFREKMYHEYMSKVAERTERRQQKVIKISSRPSSLHSLSDQELEKSPQNTPENQLELEFLSKARERMSKLGINLDEEPESVQSPEKEKKPDEELPKHLQEFMELTTATAPQAEAAPNTPTGVWSPGTTPEPQRKQFNFCATKEEPSQEETEPVAPVWTPKSAQASPTSDRKFRPVNFESPKTPRKTYNKPAEEVPKPPTDLPIAVDSPSHSQESSVSSSTQYLSSTRETVSTSTTHTQETSGRLVTSHSLPDTSLPRAQNPTITLLQKAREGQLPRGAHYLDQNSVDGRSSPSGVRPNEVLYSIRREQESETEDKRPKKLVELGPRKIEGIGPTTKEGIPIVLRSEVQDENQQKWYKRMYDSLHKAEKDSRYPCSSSAGYLSEPEPVGGYDSEYASAKYATLDRRRIRNKENDFTTSTMPRSKLNAVKHAVDVYKNQPGRIEDYEPGHSSIAEKETKQWWDEVMDIFDGQFDQTQKSSPRTHAPTNTNTNKPFMTYALKESGYESDSTLVFKRRDETQQLLSPAEQKQAYKVIQKGGDVPLHGLRKPVPEKPKESPHRYVESEVTIHYRSPVRSEEKEAWSEEELQRRQAEAMRRIYQEERRRKYLQELQDMYSRRHTDNFTPSQKSPIPLNRYDDFVDDLSPGKPRDRTPEPKLVARALYNFIGQTSRELTFRRGDIIYVRRQVDKNWYEGEHNAMIGLFPLNYVEIIPYDGIRTLPKRPTEGQARAKFNFQAQTHLELPLVKGELVLLTRRVDQNWFEGRIGNRKGIFPVSYVEVLVEPGERAMSPVRVQTPTKPVASPAAHSLHISNNTSHQHHYQPPRPVSYTSLPRQKTADLKQAPVNQTLHIDTQNEPVPYRVLYNYKPQNEDELELVEGETVYVMEKCDDGWYVGSSQRTGYLGTFPGNYVERQV